jgi:hypothetical protein
LSQVLDYFGTLLVSRDLYRLLDDSKSLRVARWRYTLLCQDSKYQGVRELVAALDLLAGPKLAKAMAFVQQPAGGRYGRTITSSV